MSLDEVVAPSFPPAESHSSGQGESALPQIRATRRRYYTYPWAFGPIPLLDISTIRLFTPDMVVPPQRPKEWTYHTHRWFFHTNKRGLRWHNWYPQLPSSRMRLRPHHPSAYLEYQAFASFVATTQALPTVGAWPITLGMIPGLRSRRSARYRLTARPSFFSAKVPDVYTKSHDRSSKWLGE